MKRPSHISAYRKDISAFVDDFMALSYESRINSMDYLARNFTNQAGVIGSSGKNSIANALIDLEGRAKEISGMYTGLDNISLNSEDGSEATIFRTASKRPCDLMRELAFLRFDLMGRIFGSIGSEHYKVSESLSHDVNNAPKEVSDLRRVGEKFNRMCEYTNDHIWLNLCNGQNI